MYFKKRYFNTTAHNIHQCRKTPVSSFHRCLINTGVEKNEQYLNRDYSFDHRRLSNRDRLLARTTCLVCFISTANGQSKKKRKKARNVALVAGT